MSNASSSSRISSGPLTVFALSLLENMATDGEILLGKSRTYTLIFQAVIPVVLLAKNSDADWALEVLETIIRESA